MTIQEVVDKILEYHPHLPDYHGCDSFKCGNPGDQCTGVVTALTPNIHVIREAVRLGANLIVVHEPTFYTSEDGPGWFEDFPNSVYEEKRKLLDEHGIAVWRDHDHLHFHRPDGIFTGVLKYLGWEKYAAVEFRKGNPFAHFIVNLPMPVTLGRLCEHLMEKIGLNGLRYIGDPNMKVSCLAVVGHLYPMQMRSGEGERVPEYGVNIIRELEEKVDVILPGEVIDWTVLSYIRDAVELGKNKAMINLGHFNWEELGMKYAKDWLSQLLGDAVSVTYVPSEDMYQFRLRG